MLVFMEGGKPENPEKNRWGKARTNNKLNPDETASTGIEPGSQRWEASAYPLYQLCSPWLFSAMVRYVPSGFLYPTESGQSAYHSYPRRGVMRIKDIITSDGFS